MAVLEYTVFLRCKNINLCEHNLGFIYNHIDMSTTSNNDTHTTQDCLTVLIADDQPICLAILERLLESKNVTVETAVDGQAALALWQSKQHSLVITDCHMPNMDGYALATSIRDIEQAENLNPCMIVALSGNTLEEERQHCLAAGINEVLSKPIQNAQIDTLLSSWQAPSEMQQTDIEQMVDISILDQIFPDANKQLEILTGFQTHIQTDYLDLQNHAAQDNLTAVENTAHRMKGSSKMVGVNGIAKICEHIESKAKKGLIADNSVFSSLGDSIQALSVYLAAQTQLNTVGIKQGGIE